jgi:hypothetical protein
VIADFTINLKERRAVALGSPGVSPGLIIEASHASSEKSQVELVSGCAGSAENKHELRLSLMDEFIRK